MKNNSLFGAAIVLTGVVACKVAHNRGYVKALRDCRKDLDLAISVAESVKEEQKESEKKSYI